MNRADLLIEIGTEELPPKSLKLLGQAFASGIEEGLGKRELDFEQSHWYASPRRLALRRVEPVHHPMHSRIIQIESVALARGAESFIVSVLTGNRVRTLGNQGYTALLRAFPTRA